LSFPNKNLVESIDGSMPLIDFAASSLARLAFWPNANSIGGSSVGTGAEGTVGAAAGTRAGAAVDETGIHAGFSAASGHVAVFLAH